MNIYREVRKKMSSDLGYDFHSDTWTDESIELFNGTVDTTKIVVEKLNIDSVDYRRELLIGLLINLETSGDIPNVQFKKKVIDDYLANL